jgi:hypothetical protein
VNWDIADFVVFSALVVGVVGIGWLALRKPGNAAYPSGVGVALAAAFLLVWVNGAVGIIGNENNDANMLFFGVLAIGIIGALVARYEPRGLMRAMYATALAQATVGVIALVAGWGSAGPVWPWDVLVLTAFFTAMWTTSGWLFGRRYRHP